MSRLGVVTTSYPRWPGDPAGSFVQGHVRWLARHGHAVDVLAAGSPDPADATRDPRGAVSVTRVPDRGGLFYQGGAPEAHEARAVRATVASARFTAALAAAVRAHARGWDAVACHWLVPSAVVAAPLTRGPLLAIAHSGDVHLLHRRGLLGATLAALLARGARLVFVAAELLELAREATPRPLRGRLDDAALVHPMGLDLTRFRAVAAARARRPRATPARVLFVGRLVPVKGVEVLLDALAGVAAPVELIVAGDGPLRAALEARAGAAPPRHRVRFVGAVTPDRRDELLREADLLCAPSIVLPGGRTEGTPTIVLEAVASAVPVVCSDAGGLASLPAPWVRRAPAGDARALGAALAEALAGDPQPAANLAAESAKVLDWGVVGRRLHAHWMAGTAQ